MIELDRIYNEDCLVGMGKIPNGSVDVVLTDFPYNEVNRSDNGLRRFNKGNADIGFFDTHELVKTLCDKTNGSVYIFCGINQVSGIRMTMTDCGLSTRLIVWEKSNPSPINGEHIWLSGIECCVFGKKQGAVYNYFCKNTVLKFPCGNNEIHPTQKPVNLFRYLILASTNEGDIVLDPFIGSGTTAIACIKEKRHFIGFELDKEYFDKATERIANELKEPELF